MLYQRLSSFSRSSSAVPPLAVIRPLQLFFLPATAFILDFHPLLITQAHRLCVREADEIAHHQKETAFVSLIANYQVKVFESDFIAIDLFNISLRIEPLKWRQFVHLSWVIDWNSVTWPTLSVDLATFHSFNTFPVPRMLTFTSSLNYFQKFKSSENAGWPSGRWKCLKIETSTETNRWQERRPDDKWFASNFIKRVPFVFVSHHRCCTSAASTATAKVDNICIRVGHNQMQMGACYLA